MVDTIYFDDFKETRPFNSDDRRLTAGGVGGLGVSYTIPYAGGGKGGMSLPSMHCITMTLSAITKAILARAPRAI
jgi:hypothetical protein